MPDNVFYGDAPDFDYYDHVLKEIPGVRVTSGFRTPEYQADMRRRGYKPAKGSKHLSGDALDILPPEGKPMAWLAQELRKKYPEARLLNEGNHIHTIFPGYGKAPALGGAAEAGLVNPKDLRYGEDEAPASQETSKPVSPAPGNADYYASDPLNPNAPRVPRTPENAGTGPVDLPDNPVEGRQVAGSTLGVAPEGNWGERVWNALQTGVLPPEYMNVPFASQVDALIRVMNAGTEAIRGTPLEGAMLASPLGGAEIGGMSALGRIPKVAGEAARLTPELEAAAQDIFKHGTVNEINAFSDSLPEGFKLDTSGTADYVAARDAGAPTSTKVTYREGETPTTPPDRAVTPPEGAVRTEDQSLPPRTAEQEAVYQQAVQEEGDFYNMSPERLAKAIQERDFQAEVKLNLAKKGLDQNIVHQPAAEASPSVNPNFENPTISPSGKYTHEVTSDTGKNTAVYSEFQASPDHAPIVNSILIDKATGRATVNVNTGNIETAGEMANTYGPNAIRDLVKEALVAHPEIKEITGVRKTGAGGSKEISQGMSPGLVDKIRARASTDNVVPLDRPVGPPNASARPASEPGYVASANENNDYGMTSAAPVPGSFRPATDASAAYRTPKDDTLRVPEIDTRLEDIDQEIKYGEAPNIKKLSEEKESLLNERRRLVKQYDPSNDNYAQEVTSVSSDRPGPHQIVRTDHTAEPINDQPLEPNTDVPSGGGEPPAGGGEPPVDIVTRITQDLKTAGSARKEQTELYKAERSKRFGAAKQALDTGQGKEAFTNALSELKGELPKPDFEAVGGRYTQDDIDELFNKVLETPTLTTTGKISAHSGLTKLLEGTIPQPKELAYLSETFPAEFIKAVMSKRGNIQKAFGTLGEAWNLPKSVMSSADLSAPLRQGIGLSYRGEYWDAFGKMFKYAVSQKQFDALENAIKTHPNYELAERSNLAITTTAGKLGAHEDLFRSHLAEKLPVIGPVIRGSERAYVGFLNKLRFDTFNSLVKDAEALGHDLNDPAVSKGIANYINVMTGRGGLGKLERASDALNSVLFSPRLVSSRLQMLAAPAQALGKRGVIAELPVGMRREAAKSYASMIGAYSTAIGLASLAGYSVDDDPRSSDFGKIRDGNTRVDLGSGIIQYVTAGTRALMRQSTALKSGETRDLKTRGDTPLDSDMRFIFNKTHPSLSLILDQQRGADAVGKPFAWGNAILNRLTPMGIPDIVETLREHPDPKGALYATLGILGAGLQNFDENAPRETPKTTETTLQYGDDASSSLKYGD